MSLDLAPNAMKLLDRLKQGCCGMTDVELETWADCEGINFPRAVFRVLIDAGLAKIQTPELGTGRPVRYKPTNKAWEIA